MMNETGKWSDMYLLYVAVFGRSPRMNLDDRVPSIAEMEAAIRNHLTTEEERNDLQ